MQPLLDMLISNDFKSSFSKIAMVIRQGRYSPQIFDVPASLEFVLQTKGLHSNETYAVLNDVLKGNVEQTHTAIAPIIDKVCDQIKAIERDKEGPLGPFFEKYYARAEERWGARVFTGYEVFWLGIVCDVRHLEVSNEFAALWRDIADDLVAKHNTTWVWPDYAARGAIAAIQTTAKQMLETLKTHKA